MTAFHIFVNFTTNHSFQKSTIHTKILYTLSYTLKYKIKILLTEKSCMLLYWFPLSIGDITWLIVINHVMSPIDNSVQVKRKMARQYLHSKSRGIALPSKNRSTMNYVILSDTRWRKVWKKVGTFILIVVVF